HLAGDRTGRVVQDNQERVRGVAERLLERLLRQGGLAARIGETSRLEGSAELERERSRQGDQHQPSGQYRLRPVNCERYQSAHEVLLMWWASRAARSR